MLLIKLHLCAFAQSEESDFNTNFAFSVHSIDDFFDRFNAKPNTAFQNYLGKNYPGVSFSREKLVYSLFNKRNKFFYQNSNVSDFVRQVTDSCAPSFTRYSDKYWYAELKCTVVIRAKPQSIILVLKVEQPGPGLFKWSVVSAKSDVLKMPQQKTVAPAVIPAPSENKVPRSSKYFLSPISHGIDFVNLENFFSSGSHASDYLYDGKISDELKYLVGLINGGKIRFSQVNKITYHLLQINGWVVSVNYFNYNAKNSGWLIDNLMKVTPDQKTIFLKNRLNIVI